MEQLTKDELRDLLTPSGETCVSLYLPTSRAPVESRQDLIRFKNMVRETEEQLIRSGLRGPEVKEFLAPLQRLLEDLSFWQYRSDGLAVFSSRGLIRPYRLPLHFEELVMVANRFHLKPLLPLFSEESGFYILALSQKEIRLLQGNRYGAWEVELEDIPTSLAEAVRYDGPEKQLQFHSKTPSGSGGRRQAVFFAHGVGTDDSKDDIRRYLQQIDKGLKDVLRQDRLPLMLAGVDYLLSIYREVNTYPQLLGEGIIGNPELLSPEELHERGWKVVQPLCAKAGEEAVSQYSQLAGTGRTARDIAEIVPVAAQGRVEKLVIARGVQIWGNFTERGTVELHEEPAAGDEDLLDLAAVQTLLNGGMVYTVAPEAIPDNVPVVALLRY